MFIAAQSQDHPLNDVSLLGSSQSYDQASTTTHFQTQQLCQWGRLTKERYRAYSLAFLSASKKVPTVCFVVQNNVVTDKPLRLRVDALRRGSRWSKNCIPNIFLLPFIIKKYNYAEMVKWTIHIRNNRK